jgi:LmbE family N-acetylglucosaminyl deacetylase
VRAEHVEEAMVSLLEPRDLVLAPWAHDGHPDHDQVGMAAERASQRAGASLLAYLVWAWHWAQPSEIPWEKACRVELDDATASRKREAVQCFTSQLAGPEPILSAGIVRRLTRDFEVFLSP